MADPRASTASNPRRAAAPPAWYAAAVVGLAVFLGGMLVTHPPIVGYRAEATLVRVASENLQRASAVKSPPIDTSAAESWLKSGSTLRQIAAEDAAGLASPRSQRPLTNAEITALRDHLNLVAAPQPHGEQWTIQYQGGDRKQAKRIARSAAEALAGYLDRASDNRPGEVELGALKREIQFALDEEERLQDEIEQLRHEQLAAALLHERQQQAIDSKASQAEGEDSPEARRRSSIAQKIDELRIEYRKLAATRLANHPTVAAVFGQIEQLENQLRETPGPDGIAPTEPPGGLNLQGPSASAPRRVTEARFTSLKSSDSAVALNTELESSSRLDEVRLRLREVGLQRKDAQRRLDVALQLASTTWQQQWSVADSSPAQRVGGTPQSRDLMWAAIVGVLAATTISIDWTWFRRLRILGTAAQARNALPTPLLGEIALSAAQPLPQNTAVSPVKVRVIRMAEWMLIVALFLIILAAVSQRELAAQLASDPFGTMAEAFDTLRSIGR